LLLAPPGGRHGSCYRQDTALEPRFRLLEPAFDGGSLLAIAPASYARNALLDLSQGKHRYVKSIWRSRVDPIDDTGIRLALARLGQHIGIQQKGHEFA